MNDKTHPQTLAAQAMGFVDAESKGIVPPLHTATTFIRDPDNQYRSGRVYGRDDNPTYDHSEAVLAALEGGAEALAEGLGDVVLDTVGRIVNMVERQAEVLHEVRFPQAMAADQAGSAGAAVVGHVELAVL